MIRICNMKNMQIIKQDENFQALTAFPPGYVLMNPSVNSPLPLIREVIH